MGVVRSRLRRRRRTAYARSTRHQRAYSPKIAHLRNHPVNYSWNSRARRNQKRGHRMSPQGLFPETLTDDELRSLHWISMANFRPFISKRHIEKLAVGGYIRE